MYVVQGGGAMTTATTDSLGLRRTTGGLFVAGALTFAGAAAVLSSTFAWPASQQMGTFEASKKAADLMTFRDLIEAAKLAPAIDRTYPRGEIAAAIHHMLDGKARGKLAVSVSPGRMQTPATGSTP
jgi:NADPH:quinone reductase-like Zn-dependent oxidoreductase